jgi:hypothetical protein
MVETYQAVITCDHVQWLDPAPKVNGESSRARSPSLTKTAKLRDRTARKWRLFQANWRHKAG